MKKIISIFILVLALTSITFFTSYALTHKEIPTTQGKKNFKKIEKVSSNLANNTYSSIYNLYFNDIRHKLKMDYKLVVEEDKYYLELFLYLDGKNIFTDYIEELNGNVVSDYFNSQLFKESLCLTEKEITYMIHQNKEYLVLLVSYYHDSLKQLYYIFEDNGSPLLEDGVLYLEEGITYYDEDGTIYEYDDGKLAKIDGDVIYSYVPVGLKKQIQIQEYKYTFIDGKLEKKLIQTYVDIKIKKNTANNM